MMDAQQVKASIDLLAVVMRDIPDLKKVAGTFGGEWAGPCPFCGGRDRFRVQPEQRRWWCRQCSDSDHWQDAYAYLMRRHNVGFKDALEMAANLSGHVPPMPRRAPAQPQPVDPPGDDWQQGALGIVEMCEAALWSDAGRGALAYLRDKRGLRDDTIQSWRLGFNVESRQINNLWVWSGITIPYFAGERLWAINVRRPDRYLAEHAGEDKYKMVKGSRRGLFGVNTLAGHSVAVMCEGEFDAMTLHQEAGDLAGVITLGSAKGKLNVATWAAYLLPIARLFVAFDTDATGQEGAESITALTRRAKTLTIPRINPADKDLNDYHRAGGSLRDWIAEAIGAATGPEAELSKVIDDWRAAPDPDNPKWAQAYAAASRAAGLPRFVQTLVDAGIDGWRTFAQDTAEAANPSKGDLDKLSGEVV